MSNLLSVIIATYNDARNLSATLDSLREQLGVLHSRFQVIVSDGGSTDHTPDVIKSHSDIVSIVDSRPDHGVYHGMNIGASFANGEWLHFLNAGDTFANPTSLAAWIDAVDSGGAGHAWVISGAINMRANSAPPVRIPNVPHSWWRHALGLQPHCHQATWFRRSVFEVMGGYSLDMGFASDFDLILRYGLTTKPLEIPTTLIKYLGGGISERAGAEIPRLQHEIRANRFDLGTRAAALDLHVARIVGRYNSSRRRIGAARLRVAAKRGY